MNYYQLLGVAPDATTDEINNAYAAKMAQLHRGEYTNAPEDVVAAEHRASAAFEVAMKTLSDSALRATYDGELRLAGELAAASPGRRESWRRRHAEHVWAMEHEMGKPMTSVFGLEPPPDDDQERKVAAATGGLAEPFTDTFEESLAPALYDPVGDLDKVADWFAPHPQPSKTVVVPNVCGLHASDAFYEIAIANLQIRFERLTPNPGPGDGVVVGQDPEGGASARRHSVVTVQVVHQEATELETR